MRKRGEQKGFVDYFCFNMRAGSCEETASIFSSEKSGLHLGAKVAYGDTKLLRLR